MRTEKNISFELANQIPSASVVVRAFTIRAIQRADNAGPYTLASSQQKAYTSTSAKNTTLAMIIGAQKNPAAANLVYLPGFLLLGGDVPIKVGKESSVQSV